MIAVAVLVVLGLVLIAALWSRIASARLDRRSVEGYGRALDTLGGVAKRSEAGVPLNERPSSDVARTHVQPSADAERHARASAPPITPAPLIRIRPPGPSGDVPVFSDVPEGSEPAASPNGSTPDGAPREVDDPTLVLPRAAMHLPEAPSSRLEEAGPDPGEEPLTTILPVVPPPGGTEPGARVFDDEPGPVVPSRGALRPGLEVRSQRMRRAATGAAAAVALGALGAGGWQLAADSHASPSGAGTGSKAPPRPSGTPQAAPPTGSTQGGTGATSAGVSGATRASGTGRSRHHGTPPTVATTGTLQPTSTSNSLVAYQAPGSDYAISFTVSGSSACWVGAQTPGGHYVWMQTLAPGQTATYQASGPVVVRIGAPPALSVTVNGRPVALPPGNVQPYDISFTPASAA